jgi:hypothetical protein
MQPPPGKVQGAAQAAHEAVETLHGLAKASPREEHHFQL